MPRIKDLGINVIPETMRPPEIGPGGACVPCTLTVGPVCAPGGNECTFSPAVNAAAAVCACTHITNPCFGCTIGITPTFCYGGTNCGFVSPVTWHGHTIIAQCPPPSCPHLSCWESNCGFVSPTLHTPTQQTVHQSAGLTRESIAQLKQQLQEQINRLDEHAKTIGPRTAEQIDAREKELKSELEELSNRRNDLKKSK